VTIDAATSLGAAELTVGVLGFESTVRRYPGALFVSAGGYHHHLGLNTWAGEGAPAPPEGALGLRWFTIVLPDQAALEGALGAAAAVGLEAADENDQAVVTDPSGDRVVLTTW
jgi:catechol 2,3-dioxygenase